MYIPGSGVWFLRRRLAFHGLVGGTKRFGKRTGIFSGVGKLAYMSAKLTYAFTDWAIWDCNYPIVGTTSVYVVDELGLVVRRRYYASIYPVFRRLERYV